MQEMSSDNPLAIVPKVPFLDECAERLWVLTTGQAMEPKGFTYALGTDKSQASLLMTGSGTMTLIDFVQEWRVDEATPSSFRRSDQFATSIQEAPAGTMQINLSVPVNWATNVINVTSSGYDSFDGSGTFNGTPFSVWSDTFDKKIWRIVRSTISRGDIYLVTPTRYGYDVSVRVEMEYYDPSGNKQFRLQTLDFTVYSFNLVVTGEGVVIFDSPTQPQTIRPFGGGGSMFVAAALVNGVGGIDPEYTFDEWALAVARTSADYEVPAYC
jgi:hypothetical protein